MDSPEISPEKMSHAMLIAILMDNGGSMEVPAQAFAPDCLGGSDGSFHAISMETTENGNIRVSVQPRPDVEDGGFTVQQ